LSIANTSVNLSAELIEGKRCLHRTKPYNVRKSLKHLPFGKGNPGIASMYTTSSSGSTAETNAEVASKSYELNPGMLVKAMTMRSVT
jgi:hypothetical protein